MSTTKSTVLDPAHILELQEIWILDKRMPTADSRRAWATARNLGTRNVSNWFYRKQRTAKTAGIELLTDTYELPIGTPPMLLNPPASETIKKKKLDTEPARKKRKIEPKIKTEDPASDDTLVLNLPSDSSTLYDPSSNGPDISYDPFLYSSLPLSSTVSALYWNPNAHIVH